MSNPSALIGRLVAVLVGIGLGVLLITAWGPDDVRILADPPAIDTTGTDASMEAPDFRRPTMGGGTFQLSDQRGTIVVLNFWATWCAPCRKEIPDFIALQDEFADEVQFVGISLDQGGFSDVRPFAEEMGINYPIVIDDGTIARQYGGVPTVPTTFVVGTDGTIEGYAPGLLTEDMLRPELKQLIADE